MFVYTHQEKHTLCTHSQKKVYVEQEVKVHDLATKAFVDCGCTFNAISTAFARRANIAYERLPNPLECEIGDGRTMRTERRVAQAEFDLGKLGRFSTYCFVLDILPMNMDVLLGMDFLQSVNPNIDWKTRKIFPRQAEQKAYQEESIEESQHYHRLHFHRAIPHESSVGTTKVITPKQFEEELRTKDPDTFCFILKPHEIAPTVFAQPTEKVQRLQASTWEALKDNPAFPILKKYRETVFAEKLDIRQIQHHGSKQHEHTIELTDDTPFNIKQFRLSPEQQSAVERWTTEMVQAGLIRKSTSPFNSPLFCVKKPIGWRIVHDFRVLNSRTRIPREPMPRKDDILDAMVDGYYFSCMDLLSGYYQLLLRHEDAKFTAFSTPTGHYEYVVTAQGLAGAPSTFNRFVQAAFANLRDICRAYFDDLYVFTRQKTVESHLEALDKVLKRCQDYGIILKLSKCIFLAPEIPVLGDFVGRDGIRIDPDKVAVIRGWPLPQKVSEMKSFLGTIVYCSKFLKDYGRLVAPLQRAIAGSRSKHQRITLSGDQLTAFSDLKVAMTTAPVLAIADFSKPFGIRLDASDFAIGGVLYQIADDGSERPIAYCGRKLSRAELRYPVREKELLAIMYALRVWRPYLLDQPFTVETDHKSLETILTQRKCSQRLARWLNELSEFRPEFKWIPGITNETADGISRRPDFVPANGERASSVDLRDLLRSILAENDADEEHEDRQLFFSCLTQAELFCYLLSDNDVATRCRVGYPKDPEFATVWKYFLEEGKDSVHGEFRYQNELLWRVKDDCWQLCIPNDETLRNQIIFSEHDVIVKGHPGRYKTEQFLNRKYYWKGLGAFVRQYCRTCEKCSRNKHRQSRPPGRLHPLPIPEARWEDITMDFIVDLPLSGGYNSVWVMVDRLSKRAHFIPIHMGESQSSAVECARIFCKEFIRLHGLPISIVSDRDTRFTSTFWVELMRLLGIKHGLSSAFRPSTDGQSERTNRFLEDYLRNYIHPRQDNWHEFIYSAEFAYNSRYHESIKMSPFEADLGYVPKSFPDHVFEKLLGNKRKRSEAFEFGRVQQQILEQAKVNLQEAQKRMQAYYNKNRPIQNFEVDDYVFISSKNLDVEHLGIVKGGSRKLAPLWIGPYKVVEKTTPDTYRIQLPLGLRLHPEFHTSLLKPYHQDVDTTRNNRPNEGMIAAGGDEGYLVDSIVGHKKRGRSVFFRVRWLGYSPEEDTWEPYENLKKPVGHLLVDYVERNNLRKTTWLKD